MSAQPFRRDRTAIVFEVAQLRIDNALLRGKLAELAKECAECGGTGCVEVMHGADDDRLHAVTEDCEVCADIRVLLQ